MCGYGVEECLVLHVCLLRVFRGTNAVQGIFFCCLSFRRVCARRVARYRSLLLVLVCSNDKVRDLVKMVYELAEELAKTSVQLEMRRQSGEPNVSVKILMDYFNNVRVPPFPVRGRWQRSASTFACAKHTLVCAWFLLI